MPPPSLSFLVSPQRKKLENARSSIQELQGELQLSRLELDHANAEVSRLMSALVAERAAHEDILGKLGDKAEECGCVRDTLDCLRENIGDLAAERYEKVYQNICGTLDPEGWRLYWAAKKHTGIDPCRAFPTEDCLGRFETADGHELIKWIEICKFGTCDWEPLNHGYEIAVNPVIHADTKEYKQYRSEIYKRAVKKLLGIEMERQPAHMKTSRRHKHNAPLR